METMNDLIPVESDETPDRIENTPLNAQGLNFWTQDLSIGLPRRAKAEKAGAIWQVPLNRSAHFTGREKILAELHAALRSRDVHAHTQALVGMAGIGKTQIALEYAHRHREEYAVVWWIRADNETTLTHDFSILARELFPGTQDRHTEATREAVRHELEKRGKWLLISDGTADPNTVAACVPVAPRGHVIVTSRNPNWRGIGSVFPIQPLERNESIFFLRSRSGREDSVLAVGQLAKALGDLPLALEQAAALIEHARISFTDYMRRFERHWADLLSRGVSGERQDSVAMSLEVSFRQLESTTPAAADLLNLLAFVAPDGFHKQWLANGAGVVGDTLTGTVGNPVYLDEAIAALLRYSLIDVRYDTISMHRIVGALARNRLTHEQRTDCSHKALRLMDSSFVFDANDPRTWAASAAMLPHALAAVDYAQQTDVTVAAAAVLLNRVGQCLFRSARYEQARIAFDQALAIGYRIYGETNPRLSAIANNLGRVLMKLGDVAPARQQFEWAISLDEKAYGPSHPHVAEVLNNYGLCLVRLGDTVLAREQFERALNIYENQFGPSHPNSASILNNLGFIRLNDGDLTEAWDLLQRALGSAHAAYGPNHPDVASILLNLGDVLRRQGSHAAARAQYTRAVVIDEIVYGPQHPDLARDLAHLGDLLMEMNEYETACRHFERALQIDELTYGGKHPNLIPRLNDLGRCLKHAGEIDPAVECFARSAELMRLYPQSPAHETPAIEVA